MHGEVEELPELIEIRWHARGGQGAKTAAVMLAEAASAAGRYIQGFPEYGPERMGAPILAFNRISEAPITLHCNVANPKLVVVLDPTLIGSTDVTRGLEPGGTVIVNTPHGPEEMRQRLGLDEAYHVYTLDASRISLQTIGRDIPNTPMMGALMRVTGMLSREDFLNLMKHELHKKFKAREEIVKGNLEAMDRAFQEVKGE
jgi:pyruvate ferredoxin oxidoreductase gamma subunit